MIRKVQYNIEYVHILSFKEEYKQAIIPFFGFDGLRYGIDNENTIHESIRLIFKLEFFALFIRKEGITFIYEGDANDLKNQNGAIKIFWDLFENIKKFQGFKKSTRHSIIVHNVDIKESNEVDAVLSNNDYFKINPFGKLDEFACIYEYTKENSRIKFEFGNYSPKDIAKHELTPFKNELNKDLMDNVGLMSRLEIKEECGSPTFNKFKALLTQAEGIISSFN
jgi:hypothetical protein